MSFKGYKYKFKINASHSININNKKGNIHFHTIDIAIYVKKMSNEFILYDDVEKIIGEYLNIYSGKYLNEIEPFNNIEPTIENIGYVFFKNVKNMLLINGFEMVKMEISEIPTRIFIIRNTDNEESADMCAYENSVKSEDRNKCDFQNDDYNQISVENNEKEFAENKNENNISQDSIIKKINLSHNNNFNTIDEKKIRKEKHKKITLKNIKILLSLAFILICSVSTALYVKNSGVYPTGFDVYGHLFKSDLLYESMKTGDLYPLYTNLWYSGIQPFRYLGPFPYYVLACFQWITNGQAMEAYIIFIGVSVALGAAGFLKFGIKTDRILLCTILGILWFFMPENARIFFSEGNIPRMTIAIILPYLFYYVWDYLESKRKRNMFHIIILMSLIVLCNVMVAAMVVIAAFIFCSIYSLINKKCKESIETIVGMMLSSALVGIWLFPAINGSQVAVDSSSTASVMESLSSKAVISLNPFFRMQGGFDIYYYGLSVLVISFVGLAAGSRKTVPGFVTSVMIFLGTTTAFVPIISRLPLNQFLWMTKFTPIAYVLFFISLIEWKKCRKIVIVLFCMMLMLDSYPIINTYKNMYTMSKMDMQDAHERYLLKKAKEITSQRLAIYDKSEFGSYPSYYVASDENGEKSVQYAYGWDWKGDATSQNVMMLNTSLEKGYYNYLFDRSIEMGCDTVIVGRNQLKNEEGEIKKLKKAAALSGYKLVEDSDMSLLFKLDAPETFGTLTRYTGLAIGSSAKDISLKYPSFEEGKSYDIDDYTFEELKKYSRIFLSGFKYKDKEKSEELIRKLTENQVKVFIDMNRIPANKLTNRMEFLNVDAQPITFNNKYPDLKYNGREIKSDKFSEEYSAWNTVYLSGLRNVTGYSNYENGKLPFAGTGENENIIFIGYNLVHYEMEADDEGIGGILDDIFDTKESDIPERRIVPIDVYYEKNKIRIVSSEDNLNTTIAFQDNFSSLNNIINKNNLLVVKKGVTEVYISYPYFIIGMIVSITGFIGITILISVIYNKNIFKK